MTNAFCKRTARKIKKLGHAPKAAAFYSRFFFVSMLSVSGIIVTGMHRRKGVKVLMEETSRSLRHLLACLIAVFFEDTGAVIMSEGPAAGIIVPDSFLIPRH
jgi:hypothetical protein